MFKTCTGVLVLLTATTSVALSDGGSTGGENTMPRMSIFFDGRFSSYDNDPEDYEITGAPLGGEAGLSDEGFSLEDTELVVSGNIDDLFFGRMTAGLHDDDGATEIELEEAFFETLGLPAGFTLKAGRFFSRLGYFNERHAHSWDFADAPLVYRALLGRQLINDGVQLSWTVPTPLFIQLGGELGRGDRFPGAADDGQGAYTLFARLGGDLNAHHHWQLAAAYWSADAEHRESGGHGHDEDEEDGESVLFTGDTDVTSVGAKWRWAPGGNPKSSHLALQVEYLQREEDGDIEIEGGDHGGESTAYDGDQSGWYAQAVYQFSPIWSAGLRYGELDIENSGDEHEVLEEAGLDTHDHTPKRSSVMVEYNYSTHSLVRLQYNEDDSYEDADTQVFLQYVMHLGGHGGHRLNVR